MNHRRVLAALARRQVRLIRAPHADFLKSNSPQRDQVFTRLDGREKRAHGEADFLE
jgi:hypothetical protein